MPNHGKLAALTTIVCLAVSAGCSSTTVIRASDPEAKIFVDGQYRGKGQITHTDSNVAFSKTKIRFEREGCEPQENFVRKDAKLQVGPLLAGCLCIFPWLWVMGYENENSFDFECKKSAPAGT